MPASRTPSRTSSVGSGGNVESQATAIVGAALAFGRAGPKGSTPSNTGVGINGALAAASTAGTRAGSRHGSYRSPGVPPSPGPPSGSRSAHNKGKKDLPPLRTDPTPNLYVPNQPDRGLSRSPSNYAMQVAKSRSPNTATPNPIMKPFADSNTKPPAGQKSQPQGKSNGKPLPDNRTDSTSIPPTTSLVDLFERKTSQSDGSKKSPEPVVAKPNPDMAIRSPKPVRVRDGGNSVFKMELEEEDNNPSKPVDETEMMSVHDDDQASIRSSVSPPSGSKSMSSPIAIRKRPSQMAMPPPDLSTPGSMGNRLQPSPSPLRYASTGSPSSRTSTRNVTSPAQLSSSQQSYGKSLHAQYNQLYPRHRQPFEAEANSLANAMVASSLASSRAPSPRRDEPPQVPARRRHRHGFSFSRTPSPSKHMMRHTLRKTNESETDSDDELHPYGKHKKKRHIRPKHPNKHHEGDRKRWRDAVTERERRRYEGLWAANKGMYCTLTIEEDKRIRETSNTPPEQVMKDSLADSVSNIVAREIWSRSRLHESVLESIWELVDTNRIGRLSKVEFVVGLWLIDQRLKGRKLPVKVTDSVWGSARNIQGIKIKKAI